MLGGAWIGGLSIGLLAAAPAEIVISETFVVRVYFRTTHVAHAAVPGPAGGYIVEVAVGPLVVTFRGGEFVGVGGHVINTIVADAAGLRATHHALPQSFQLGRIARQQQCATRKVPLLVTVANGGVAGVTIRKGFVVGAFASFGPFAFGAYAFAPPLAMKLRLIEVLHHHRALAFTIGKLVAVDAVAQGSFGAHAAGGFFYLLAHPQMVLRRMPFFKAGNL